MAAAFEVTLNTSIMIDGSITKRLPGEYVMEHLPSMVQLKGAIDSVTVYDKDDETPEQLEKVFSMIFGVQLHFIAYYGKDGVDRKGRSIVSERQGLVKDGWMFFGRFAKGSKREPLKKVKLPGDIVRIEDTQYPSVVSALAAGEHVVIK